MVHTEGRYIKCITSKFGNFTNGKRYAVISRAEYINGTPTDFVVIDDEGDSISVDILLRKPTKFILLLGGKTYE